MNIRNYPGIGKYIEATLDVASVAANVSVEQTFTVPGVKAGDFIYMNPPALSVALGVGACRVVADNTVGIWFTNTTAGALDPSAATFKFITSTPKAQ